jgi:2-hydroxychromene-2-carboxylate isomerase
MKQHIEALYRFSSPKSWLTFLGTFAKLFD